MDNSWAADLQAKGCEFNPRQAQHTMAHGNRHPTIASISLSWDGKGLIPPLPGRQDTPPSGIVCNVPCAGSRCDQKDHKILNYKQWTRQFQTLSILRSGCQVISSKITTHILKAEFSSFRFLEGRLHSGRQKRRRGHFFCKSNSIELRRWRVLAQTQS